VRRVRHRLPGRLDRHGPDGIRAQLGGIFHANGGKPLVLTCFEDLSKDPCHRRLFAQWYQAKTGVVVPEALTV
jgi:hypothetical protein